MPTRIPRGSKLHDVWVAIRDHGPLTGRQVSKLCGWPETQIGPLLFALVHMGAAAMLGCGIEREYVAARLARWFA